MGERRFVDRERSLDIPNTVRERRRSEIQAQLDANGPITISVDLPADIYQTGSSAIREHVFARIGVKALGVQDMLFTQVQRIDI